MLVIALVQTHVALLGRQLCGTIEEESQELYWKDKHHATFLCTKSENGWIPHMAQGQPKMKPLSEKWGYQNPISHGKHISLNQTR